MDGYTGQNDKEQERSSEKLPAMQFHFRRRTILQHTDKQEQRINPLADYAKGRILQDHGT